MIQFPAGNIQGSGYLATPESGQGRGILVLHAWWGLNDIFKGLCDRLAKEGFVALAPDLFGGKIATTVAEAQVQIDSADSQSIQAIALGAIDFLRSHPAVSGHGLGAIGFSFGAAWAVLLSTLKPEAINAVVLFYGAYPVDFSPAQAAYLGHYSDQDEWEPMEGIREMEANMLAAGREATLHIYPNVKHWFFEPNRPEFDPQAAGLAWQRTVDFLRNHLK